MTHSRKLPHINGSSLVPSPSQPPPLPIPQQPVPQPGSQPHPIPDVTSNNTNEISLPELQNDLVLRCLDISKYLSSEESLIKTYQDKVSTYMKDYNVDFLVEKTTLINNLINEMLVINDSADSDSVAAIENFKADITKIVSAAYGKVLDNYDTGIKNPISHEKQTLDNFKDTKLPSDLAAVKELKNEIDNENNPTKFFLDAKKKEIDDLIRNVLKVQETSIWSMSPHGFYSAERSSSNKLLKNLLSKHKKFLRNECEKPRTFFISKATTYLYHGNGLMLFSGPVREAKPIYSFFSNLDPRLSKHHFFSPSLQDKLTANELSLLTGDDKNKSGKIEKKQKSIEYENEKRMSEAKMYINIAAQETIDEFTKIDKNGVCNVF